MAKPPTSGSPSIIVEVIESEDDLDLDINNNLADVRQRLPGSSSPWSVKQNLLVTQDDIKSSRRKSSASRYGFDEAFIELVARQCQLVLETENVLGRGSFGTVVAADYQGVQVAAKIVDMKGKRQAESVKNEENGLDMAIDGGHPNVVNILDIFRLGPNTAIIILPRMRKGSLLTLLNKAPPFSFERMVTFAKQIASAVTFCHAHDLLHLDIKPQNVLIDFQDNLRLSDFGNSRKINDLEGTSPLALDGTVAYKAPELFCGQNPTTKADVYSFAVTLWQIIERETPYLGDNEHTIIYKVVAQCYRPCSRTGTNYQDFSLQKLYNLVRSCWNQNPEQRPNMDEILTQLQCINKI